MLLHEFHIPVMGTAFTIETPIKCARFGISSVMSIGDDELCETMREHYSKLNNKAYAPIKKWDEDYRARRITAYLNLVKEIVDNQVSVLKQEPFTPTSEITKYFELLPDHSPVKRDYLQMLALPEGPEKTAIQDQLRSVIVAGDLDVNVMTKIDRQTFSRSGEPLPDHFTDALSALRGFAKSDLNSSIVFSAGFNRHLYAYISEFSDFFPDAKGFIKKKITLKVSDFRSSMTQGKFLAKKGIWVSEHRIESGLNCGGHAFATDGYLLGPILQEFKQQRQTFTDELFTICNETLKKLEKPTFEAKPHTMITVQGGIGTHEEQQFLMSYYDVDRTGWATPFLLVPEATTLDDETRQLLAKAKKDDFYLSGISPLGVPFNTVKNTASEFLRRERIEAGKPGSPCPKGFLVSNTEFTKVPICTASKTYQRLKLDYLNKQEMPEEQRQTSIEAALRKTCLCEDLAASALINHNIENKRALKTAVCPGPNMAYFSKISTITEMIGHIYGRIHLLNDTYRPNLFINELKMYIDYLQREIKASLPKPTEKNINYFQDFIANIQDGMDYYKDLIPKLINETKKYQESMKNDLQELRKELESLISQYSFLNQPAPLGSLS